MDLSIIILNWNTKDLLLQCLESILEHTNNLNFETIIIDNASTDGSITNLKKYISQLKTKNLKPHIIQNKSNLGFSAGNNPGLKQAKGKYLLLLNTDTKIDYNVFPKLINWMNNHPEVGILGPKLLNKDKSLQPSAGYLPSLFGTLCQQTLPIHKLPIINKFAPVLKVSNHGFYNQTKQTGWVSGSCFLIRKKVYDQIKGLDENIFMYVEEVEYCKRAQNANWQVWYTPAEYIYHLERGSSTSGKHKAIIGTYQGLKYYFYKHQPAWQLPILIILLKLGALLRLSLNPKTYWQAFILP